MCSHYQSTTPWLTVCWESVCGWRGRKPGVEGSTGSWSNVNSHQQEGLKTAKCKSLNFWCTEFLWEKIERYTYVYLYAFPIISQYWDDAGCRNSLPRKTGISTSEVSSYHGYFQEPHGLPMGLPEIFRVTLTGMCIAHNHFHGYWWPDEAVREPVVDALRHTVMIGWSDSCNKIWLQGPCIGDVLVYHMKILVYRFGIYSFRFNPDLALRSTDRVVIVTSHLSTSLQTCVFDLQNATNHSMVTGAVHRLAFYLLAGRYHNIATILQGTKWMEALTRYVEHELELKTLLFAVDLSGISEACGQFLCPITCLIVRSCKISQDLDRCLESWNRFEIWQEFGRYCCKGGSQNLNRYQHFDSQLHRFDTSQDLTIPSLMWYWNCPLFSRFLRVLPSSKSDELLFSSILQLLTIALNAQSPPPEELFTWLNDALHDHQGPLFNLIGRADVPAEDHADNSGSSVRRDLNRDLQRFLQVVVGRMPYTLLTM